MDFVDPATLSPAKREEYEKLLAEYQASLEENPLQTYKPNSGQLPFHEAQTKYKALMGGNRSGKTTAGIVDDLIQAVDADALPEHLLPYKKWEPPVKMRIVAPKFNENHWQVTFPTIREWVPRHQLKDSSWEKAFSLQRRVLEFANGSTIQFLTFDQDLDAHAGAALHRVHFDEEPEGHKGLQLYDENRARLNDHNGDFVLTMTPLFGLSWSYDTIWQRRNEPNVTALQVDAEVNLANLNREAMEEYWASLPEEVRQARKEGRFVHFAGLFYSEFTDSKHVVTGPTKDHLEGQSVVVGIDPGLNRTGVVWVAFDNDNNALAFDELYPSQSLIPDISAQIKAKNKAWGVEPNYVIDPSARNRATVNAEQVESAYIREGIYCAHGDNSRQGGILEVKRRLQNEGLIVSRDCPHLIWEFGRYRKDQNAADEFAAVKEDDHLLDALRYVCMSRAWSPAWRPPKPAFDYSDPMKEPPYRGPVETSVPPLGAMS